MAFNFREKTRLLGPRWRLGAALAILAIAPAAQADCTSREATQAEKQFGERLSAALLAAMPAAPTNMWLPAAPRVAMGTLCKDTPVGDLQARVNARYHYRVSAAEAERLTRERRDLEAQMSALKVLPPDLKREYDAIDAQAQQAFREARNAEKDGNKSLATQKYNESSTLGTKRDAVRKRHLDAIKPQFDEVEAKWRALPAELGEFDVVLKANGYDTKPAANELDLMLGKLPSPQGGGKGFKVYGLQAVVSGPTNNAEQRRALIAGFDRARLQALIDGPPPETPAPASWSVGGPPQVAGAAAVAPAASTPAAPAVTAQPTAPAAQPVPAASPQPDATQQAKDTVNKLRGLLGR